MWHGMRNMVYYHRIWYKNQGIDDLQGQAASNRYERIG